MVSMQRKLRFFTRNEPGRAVVSQALKAALDCLASRNIRYLCQESVPQETRIHRLKNILAFLLPAGKRSAHEKFNGLFYPAPTGFGLEVDAAEGL